MPLSREEIALIVLALADGKSFTPVQIQKALFLASDKGADAFRQNSRYDFQPYDYGSVSGVVAYSAVHSSGVSGLSPMSRSRLIRWCSVKLVEAWNARQGAHMPMLFSPTIEAAITARYWFLRARCPACRITGDVDLRRLDWHRGAAVTALIPALSCRCCRPNAPFAELLFLSKASTT